MILGDVEETITTVEIDDETYEEIIKVHTPRNDDTNYTVWESGLLDVLQAADSVLRYSVLTTNRHGRAYLP